MTLPNEGEGAAHDEDLDGRGGRSGVDGGGDTSPRAPSRVSSGVVGGDGQRGAWSTNEEFAAYISDELHLHPLSSEYPKVFAAAPGVICKWRERFRSNMPLWRRLFKKQQVIKEIVEAVPVIDAVVKLVEGSELEHETFTILDLCCGKGYLSMLLSELLPAEKISKIVLVDKMWCMTNMTPSEKHISWTHIYGSKMKCEDQSIPNYYESWPIRLETAKVDLKAGRELRTLEQRFLQGRGPVILVAIHLCGTLSLKAVELFNRNSDIKFFCLKPCCLPGMVHAKRNEIFHLGEHSFDSKEVCMAGKWKRNKWIGPPRSVTKTYFERWADNLFWGMDDTDAQKSKRTIMVQTEGGYQNEFLYASRVKTSEN
mmetsp:Transcript_26833/g.61271  ORF Transcript_26833/g.61271 Transcript_26833/m.61271 type:complete len:369 (+) Transcript_26833:237-1343(+)